MSNKQAAADLSAEGIWGILRRILAENGREYFPLYAGAVVALVIIAGTTAFAAWIMRDVIDEIFVRQRGELILFICALVAGAFILRGLAMYFQATLLARIGNDLVARYQKRVYEKLLDLGVGFFSDSRSGHLAARIGENINGIRDILSLTITSFARDLVTLVGLVIVMFLQDPVLSVIALLLGPMLVLGVAYVSRRVRSIVRETVNLNSKVIGTMQETFQGITVVKAFTMEDQLGQRMARLADHARERADKLAMVANRVTPVSEIFAGLAIAGVIAYGGYRATSSQPQPPGAVFSFITALLFAYDPAKRLARLKVNLERAIVNARMLYELLDLPDEQRDRDDAVPLVIEKGRVEFSKVNFAYGDGTEVLRELSFIAPANKTTAIVGPSGAGKTTVIGLLQRMYDPISGTVTIDGVDIAGVTKSSLRGQIAFVSQQPYLFEGSLADNIRFGRPDADMAAIEEAARLAYADEFITRLPLGYDTPVGENGVTLSGGQRQRISIARAIVRNAPILLLDEATSALDNESEKLVQQALKGVMRGRTTIVIAHRLSTIADADQIIVMDDGRVVETGSHGDLAKRKGGLYAKLHEFGIQTPTEETGK